MTKRIIIAGAGPGGLLLAQLLGEAGADVLVLECLTEQQHGEKNNWSDAVELDVLRDAGLPVPEISPTEYQGEWVKGSGNPAAIYEKHRVTNLAVYAADYSRKVTIDADFRHVLTDRQLLCAYQKKKARDAGAVLRFGQKITGLLGVTSGDLEEIAVSGLTCVREDGSTEALAADLVVDATGQVAFLRTMIGNPTIGQPFAQNEYGYVYRTVCAYDETEEGKAQFPFVEHYRLRSEKGYGFVHFHEPGKVDIGGGSRSLSPRKDARELVMESLEAYPHVQRESLRGGEGRNLKCMPPDSLVAGGFLVVGHAGAQINPTQGCGIGSTFSGALLAAQVITGTDCFDLCSLWPYNHRWFESRGASYAALYAKMKFLKAFSLADYKFFIAHDILNGLSLTHEYQGIFQHLTTDERRRLKNAKKQEPALVENWEKSYEKAARVYEHYVNYPKHWHKEKMGAWSSSNPAREDDEKEVFS